MNGLHEHLARRVAASSAVMAVTTGICTGVAIASDGTGSEDGTLHAVLLGFSTCYFVALALVAQARRSSVRERDSIAGMAMPAMGYAAAAPASIAVPLAVLDATMGRLGPASPPVAILSGMAAVLLLMLLARGLEDRIDPPTSMAGGRSPGRPADEATTAPILEDLP